MRHKEKTVNLKVVPRVACSMGFVIALTGMLTGCPGRTGAKLPASASKRSPLSAPAFVKQAMKSPEKLTPAELQAQLKRGDQPIAQLAALKVLQGSRA